MDNLIFIISNGISIIATCIFVNTFFAIKHQNKTKEKWLYLLYFILSTPLIVYLRNPNYNILTHIFSIFAIVQFYEGTILKRVAITVLIYATKMVIDGGVYNIANSSDALENIMKSNIWTVVISIALLGISIILKKYFKNYAKVKENQNINYALMIITPLASIFILAITLKGNYRSDTVALIALPLLIINIASYMLLGYMLRLAGEAYNNKILDLENKSYYKEFILREEKNSNIRSLKHDMNNHMFAIKLLADEQKYEELSEYIKSYGFELNNAEVFSNTNNITLDNIINTKLNEILSLKAKLEVDINIKENIDIPILDLVIVLGNILDNIIEAVSKTEDKYVHLSIKKEGKYLKITSKNTFHGERNLKEKKFVTTKKNKLEHGIGLGNIEKIAKKYKGELETQILDNKYFETKIVLFED